MFSALLSRYFWVTAYLSLAAGFWLPGSYEDQRILVPIFLGGILFFTCLKISIPEIRAALNFPLLRRVLYLVPIRLVVLPLICWGAARLLNPEWALGVLLVAAAPAGFSSVAFTDLYGGSRMFALLLVLATTSVCPITLPVLVKLLGGLEGDSSALLRRMLFLATVLVLPFALAQLARMAAPVFVERHRNRWGLWSILSSCLMIFMSVAVNRNAWSSIPAQEIVWPFFFGCLVSLLGLSMGFLSRIWLKREEATAFTCGEIWLNNGLALTFAGQYFFGDLHMVLPGVLIQIPIVATMAIYGMMIRTKTVQENPPPGIA